MSGQPLISAATGLQVIGDPTSCLQVVIYLLQQQNGNTMTGNQLIAATSAAGIPVIGDPLLALQVVIYLLANGSSGSSGGLTSAANYGGAVPGVTPTSAFSVTVDTSTGRVWWWYNGQWN